MGRAPEGGAGAAGGSSRRLLHFCGEPTATLPGAALHGGAVREEQEHAPQVSVCGGLCSGCEWVLWAQSTHGGERPCSGFEMFLGLGCRGEINFCVSTSEGSLA